MLPNISDKTNLQRSNFLPSDILTEVMLLLLDKDIQKLKVNKGLRYDIAKIHNNNYYWKKRTIKRFNLNRLTIDEKIRWRTIYKEISQLGPERAFVSYCSRGKLPYIELFIHDDNVATKHACIESLNTCNMSASRVGVFKLLLKSDIVRKHILSLLERDISHRTYEDCCMINSCIQSSDNIVSIMSLPEVKGKAFNELMFALVSWCDSHEHVKHFLKDSRIDLRYHSKILLESAKGNNLKLFLDDPRIDPLIDNMLINEVIARPSYVYDNVKLLLEDGRIDPSAQNNQAFITAVSRCCGINIIELLLQDKRVDPSDRDNQAIIESVKIRYSYHLQPYKIEVIKLLLQDKRVNPSAQNNQAFIEAVKTRNIDIITLLFEDKRVDPSAQNNAALKEICVSSGWFDRTSEQIAALELLFRDPRVSPHAHNPNSYNKLYPPVRKLLKSHPKYKQS